MYMSRIAAKLDLRTVLSLCVVAHAAATHTPSLIVTSRGALKVNVRVITSL